MSRDKIRLPASTHPTSGVGQQRRAIYTAVWERIAHARKNGCWLEVITLCESVIADRLEARKAHLGLQSSASRSAGTANQAAGHLLKSASESPEARGVYEEVQRWSKGRNAALHELAKLLESDAGDWAERYEAAQRTATDGESLARRTSDMVRRLNRP